MSRHITKHQDLIKAAAKVDIESASETVFQIPVVSEQFHGRNRNYVKKASTVPGSGSINIKMQKTKKKSLSPAERPVNPDNP